MAALSERQRDFFNQIDYLIQLIASRHANPESIAKDVKRAKMRFVRIPYFANVDSFTTIFETQDYANALVRTAVNRCALILADEVKRLNKRPPDLAFGRVLEQIATVHTEIDAFITLVDDLSCDYPPVSVEVRDWYDQNKAKLEKLQKKAALPKTQPPQRPRPRREVKEMNHV